MLSLACVFDLECIQGVKGVGAPIVPDEIVWVNRSLVRIQLFQFKVTLLID